MDDAFTTLIAVLAAFVVGVVIGLSASESSWEQDCAKIGKHRSNDKVYFCFPEGGK